MPRSKTSRPSGWTVHSVPVPHRDAERRWEKAIRLLLGGGDAPAEGPPPQLSRSPSHVRPTVRPRLATRRNCLSLANSRSTRSRYAAASNSHGSVRFALFGVAAAVREVVPADRPVFVRISATDWADGGWDVDQSVAFARRLKDLGVDLVDVSSGGLVPRARIPVGKGYQVPFARRVRDEAGVLTWAVGLIAEVRQADGVVTGGDADLVFVVRGLLREPYSALKAQQELGAEPSGPVSYGYAVKRRAK